MSDLERLAARLQPLASIMKYIEMLGVGIPDADRQAITKDVDAAIGVAVAAYRKTSDPAEAPVWLLFDGAECQKFHSHDALRSYLESLHGSHSPTLPEAVRSWCRKAKPGMLHSFEFDGGSGGINVYHARPEWISDD